MADDFKWGNTPIGKFLHGAFKNTEPSKYSGGKGNNSNRPHNISNSSNSNSQGNSHRSETAAERQKRQRALAIATLRNSPGRYQENPNAASVAPKKAILSTNERNMVNKKLGIRGGESAERAKSMIKKYQQSKGLTADGVVGRQTLASLGIRSGSLPG